jgi:hypothetical protein
MSDGTLPQEEIDALLTGADSSRLRPPSDGALTPEEIDAYLSSVGGDNPKSKWKWPYPIKGPGDSFIMYPFPITGRLTEKKQNER